MTLHPIVEKGLVVRSAPIYVAKKLKLPLLSAIIQSNTKPLPIEVHVTIFNQKTNLNSKADKCSLFAWLTRASKSKYRPCKSFTLFHHQTEDQI